MLDQVAITRHVARKHWASDCGGFEKRSRQPFAIGRQNDGVGIDEIWPNVFHRTKMRKSPVRNPSFEFIRRDNSPVLHLGGAQQGELGAGSDTANPCSCLGQFANSFVAQQTSDKQKATVAVYAVAQRREGKARQINPRPGQQPRLVVADETALDEQPKVLAVLKKYDRAFLKSSFVQDAEETLEPAIAQECGSEATDIWECRDPQHAGGKRAVNVGLGGPGKKSGGTKAPEQSEKPGEQAKIGDWVQAVTLQRQRHDRIRDHSFLPRILRWSGDDRIKASPLEPLKQACPEIRYIPQ